MVAIDAALCDSWCGSAPALSSTIVIACMAAGPSKVLKKSPRGDAIVVVSSMVGLVLCEFCESLALIL